MAAWANEEVFRFIEAYRNEETIWNPKAKDHKSKNCIKRAWIRVSDLLDIPIPVLKKKKEVLMTTYRQLKRKELSVAATCGADDIYRPSWIFYDALDAFLSDVYTCFTPRKLMDIEGVFTAEDSSEGSPSDSEMFMVDYGNQSNRKLHRHSELQEATKYIKNACNALSSVLSKQRDEENECDIFGKLLAKKLKRMPEDDRQRVMLEIDTLLLNAKKDMQIQVPQPYETQMNSTRSDATPPKYFFQLQYSK